MIFRRKRLVRLHLKEQRFSLDGILVGVDVDHYRLANVTQVDRENGQDVTLPVPGEAWVPRQDVLYVQAFA